MEIPPLLFASFVRRHFNAPPEMAESVRLSRVKVESNWNGRS